MNHHGSFASTYTYTVLASAYSNGGEMEDYGVCPSVDEYDKLIQSLWLEALDWEMAEKLQEEMKESGLRLKSITRGLIRAVKETDKEVVEAESITVVA